MAEPRTVKSLAADLRALAVRPGSTLVVHSSLSAIGSVAGGAAAALIHALREALGRSSGSLRWFLEKSPQIADA